MAQIDLRSRLLAGGAWVFAGRVGASLAILATNALATRLMSPSEAGTYFLVLSFAAAAGVLAQAGISPTIVRLVAEARSTDRHDEIRGLFSAATRLCAVAVFVVCAVALLPGRESIENYFKAPGNVGLLLLAVGLIGVRVFHDLYAEGLRGLGDLPAASVLGGSLNGGVLVNVMVLAGVGGLWLTQGQGSPSDLLAAWLVGTVPVLVMTAVALHIRIRHWPKRRTGVRALTATSWPLLISGIASIGLLQADLWIVGATRSAADTALYGAALKVVAVIAMPLLVVNALVAPFIAELNAQREHRRLERMLRSSASVAAVPATLAVLVLLFAGPLVMGTVFGPPYREAGTVAAVLALGQLANVVAGPCGMVLVMTGLQREVMVIMVASLAAFLLAAFPAAHHGLLPLAWVGAAITVVLNLAMWTVAKRKAHVATHVTLRRSP